MANFYVVPTLSIFLSIAEWSDSRLNPDPAHPHLYYKCISGTGPIEIKASINGALAPLDIFLGGDLFTTYFAEVPVWPAPALTSPAGQSSVASFVPNNPGLHLLMMRRPNGGAVGVHIYAEPAE